MNIQTLGMVHTAAKNFLETLDDTEKYAYYRTHTAAKNFLETLDDTGKHEEYRTHKESASEVFNEFLRHLAKKYYKNELKAMDDSIENLQEDRECLLSSLEIKEEIKEENRIAPEDIWL